MTTTTPEEPELRFPRVRRWLAALSTSRRAAWVLVAVALALHLPALGTGFTLDDHFQRVRIEAALNETATPIAAYGPTLWDVFVFVPNDPAKNRALVEHGVLGWAADPALAFGFFRPLSAATHVLDSLLWPGSAALAHLQSLAWLAALLVAVRLLYRRIHAHAWVAGLAFYAYALDDVRAPAVSWIANRNALVAGVFAVLALVAYDRARKDGWRPGHVLGPLAFALGLLAGESAIALLGYLAAHALVLDRAPLRDRALSLLPYLAVVVAWAAAYGTMGYGVRHSGVYVDPVDDPLHFAVSAAAHVPMLLGAHLSGVWSDLGLFVPGDAVKWLVVGFVAYLVLFTDAVSTALVRSRAARFWALGALLSALPAASAVPSDRMLTFVGLGLTGLVASFLEVHWPTASARAPASPPAPSPARRGASLAALRARFRPLTIKVWLVALVAVHLVIAPLAVPLRALTNGALGSYIERGERTLPYVREGDPEVVVVNPPSEAMLAYAAMTRAGRGEPGPGRLRALAMGRSAVTLVREAADTLRVRPAEPYMDWPMERLARLAPFAVGDRVRLRGVEVEVTEVTGDGRPAETRWRFTRPLEDPSLVFLAWSDAAIGFAPFTPPPVGRELTLPAVDLARAFRGW